MEVRELTFKGESDPKLYACGKCGKAYSPKIYGGREEAITRFRQTDRAKWLAAPREPEQGHASWNPPTHSCALW